MMNTAKKWFLLNSGGASTPPPYEWFESFANSQQPLDDPLVIETGQQLDIVAQSSDLSIAGNYLRKAGTSAAANNKIRSVESINSGAGRLFALRVICNNSTNRMGLENPSVDSQITHGFQFNSGFLYMIYRNYARNIGFSYVNDTVYDLLILLKEGQGAHYIVKDGDNYFLTLMENYYAFTEYKAYFEFGSTTLDLVDWLRVNPIEALTDDWPFDTDTLTSPSGGTSFTHDTQGWIFFKLGTRNTSGTMEVRFRVQDANNYFSLKFNTINQSQLSIYEAGVETILRTYAQMSTTTTGYDIKILLNGSSIKIWTGAESTQKADITNANFTSETDGEVTSLGNGVITEVHTMPYNVSSIMEPVV